MRIATLSLLRFGPFSDRSLDFSAAGLHLVYGANEDGKSTTRRAAEGGLFGIPERTQDAHRHKTSELRIGVRVQRESGETLEFVRRKGRVNTLLDAHGNALEAAALDPFLSGASRELFNSRYCLDHERLREGGEALLSGEGALGESLFASSLGVHDVRALLDELEAEANALFKQRGSKPELNQALKDYAEAKSALKEACLRPSDWQNVRAALDAAQRERGELGARISQVRQAISRLQRILRTGPVVAQIGETIRDRAAVGEVPLLPEDAGELRRGAQAVLARAEHERAQLAAEMVEIGEELAQLPGETVLLSRGSEIEALREERGAFIKARRDADRLEGEHDQLLQAANRVLASLGSDISLECADQLRVDARTAQLVRDLGTKGERLKAVRAEISSRADELLAEVRAAQDELTALPPAMSTDELASVVCAARSEGPLTSALAEAQRRASLMSGEVRALTRRLTPWTGDAESAMALQPPSVETVDRFEVELGAALKEEQRWNDESTRLQEDLASIDRDISRLHEHQAVPSTGALDEARGERTRYWQSIVAVWIDGASATEPPNEMATSFEAHVNAADDVADALRADADRVATAAQLVSRRADLERQIAAAELAEEEARAQLTDISGRWQSAWASAAIEPLTPREMSGWLGRLEALTNAYRALCDERAEIESLEARIAKHRRRLMAALKASGHDADGEHELDLLLEQGEQALKRSRELESQRASLKTAQNGLQTQERKLQLKLKKQREDQAAWAKAWATALEVVGLPPEETTANQAGAYLDSIAELFGHMDGAARIHHRLAGISRDARVFAESVESVAAACAPDLTATAPEEVSLALAQRLDRARNEETRRRNLETNLAKARDRERNLVLEISAGNETLAELQSLAGCEDIEGLRDAEETSSWARELDRKITALKDQALAGGDGRSLEEIVEEAAEADADAMSAGLQEAFDELATLEESASDFDQQIGEHRTRLVAMTGDHDKTAKAAQRVQSALARIHNHTVEFTNRKVAALMLRTAIERYREKHQDPVLQRASQIFETITLGSFIKLCPDYDTADRPVIKCQRPDGELVGVEGLSDGARDQLYLALRIASLERHAENGTMLPVVLDDLFVNFDDDRARAALGVLGELADKTQVIFFTHHRRLVELAREAVPAELLVQHELHEDTVAPALQEDNHTSRSGLAVLATNDRPRL